MYKQMETIKIMLKNEGLSNSSIERLSYLLFVYSIGWYDIIKIIKSNLNEYTTIANIWKLFNFLLNDCTPIGCNYEMNISKIEKNCIEKNKYLWNDRDNEIINLTKNEKELNISINTIDMYYQKLLHERQNLEEIKLELMSTITNQETLINITQNELSQLKNIKNNWILKSKLNYERSCMIKEDMKCYELLQKNIIEKSKNLLESLSSATTKNTNLQSKYNEIVLQCNNIGKQNKRLNLRVVETKQVRNIHNLLYISNIIFNIILITSFSSILIFLDICVGITTL
jgi:hypothetical protein